MGGEGEEEIDGRERGERGREEREGERREIDRGEKERCGYYRGEMLQWTAILKSTISRSV